MASMGLLGALGGFGKALENLDREWEMNKGRTLEELRQKNDKASIELRQKLEGDDVVGVKYGERWSINPNTNRPYKDPKSDYTELLIVKKNGRIVHSGKLILAPQNRSDQDGESSY
jgi:hypothetical protein